MRMWGHMFSLPSLECYSNWTRDLGTANRFAERSAAIKNKRVNKWTEAEEKKLRGQGVIFQEFLED